MLIARELGLSDPLAAACGLAAVLGHNFNVFNGFRGGKGVATSFGVVLMIDPQAALVTFVVAFAVTYLTRFVSAGSMVGGVATFMVTLVLGRPWWELLIVSVFMGLIFYQHRDNIGRLRAGSESRFGQKGSAQATAAPAKIMN